MQKRPLGRTGLPVSRICLGTMTFGEQNTEAEGHAQLDRALDRGVDFIDTAELYPIPPKAETQGATERFVGSWLKARGGRDRLTIATKVVGRSDSRWFRDAFPDCVAYGFFPHRHMTLYDTWPLIHGADERIDVRDLGFAASFFHELPRRLLA